MTGVDLTIEDGVATVRLNRPEARNALTVEMRTAIGEIFEGLGDNDAVRAVLLAATGDHFCVGGDVNRMDDAAAAAVRERIKAGAHRMVRAIHSLEKPVIAAVNGVAAGIGWSLALASDFIYASETARFSQAFTKIGLAPDGGAAFFLARRVSVPLAKSLAFSARVVPAMEAHALGLVDQIFPPEMLFASASQAAKELAAGPTRAFGLTKRLFDASLMPGLDAFLQAELEVQPLLRESSDHHEGLAAFREKRPARFQGR